MREVPSEQMLAAGLAGWSLVGALMMWLEQSGKLDREQGTEIIDHALSGLEHLAAVAEHPALNGARRLLELELAKWHAATDPSSSG